MNAQQLDTAIHRWIKNQPDHLACSYHVQMKLNASEVKMKQLTALELAGWVILDWRKRGLGISSKQAIDASQSPTAVRLLDTLLVKQLHVQVQLVLAPIQDWAAAYSAASLTPDLMAVLDAGHASVLNVAAERNEGEWMVLLAHQPPDDEPLVNFAPESV